MLYGNSRVSERRWGRRLVVVAAVVVALGLFGLVQPETARGDTVGGVASPGCVRYWAPVTQDMTGWQSLKAQYRLSITGTGNSYVVGQWQTSSGLYGQIDVFRGTGTWWVDDGGLQEYRSLIWSVSSPETYTARYVLAMPSGTADCFTVDRVGLARTPFLAPASPTPSPEPLPTASGGSECTIEFEGEEYDVPCVSPDPEPSADPSDAPAWDCPAVNTGYGTFVIDFGPTGGKVGCTVYAVYFPAGSGTPNFHVARTAGEYYRNGTASPCSSCRVRLSHGSFTADSGTWPGHGAVGTQGPGNIFGASIQQSAGTSDAWEATGSSSWDATSAWHGKWYVIGVATTDFSGVIRGQSGLRLTLTVTGTHEVTWPGGGTSGPSGSEQFCEDNPEYWACQPAGEAPPEWWSEPPDWWDGDPSNWNTVEICAPGSIASTRSACATWPPSGGGAGEEVCSEGSASFDAVLCQESLAWQISDLGSPNPVEFDPIEGALVELIEDMEGRAPFVWMGEVAEIGSGVGLVSGASLDWCMGPLPAAMGGGTICIDPYDATEGIAPVLRPALLGALVFVVAWAILRRIWAAPGGATE